MKKLYLLLVVVVCFCSCQESREEAMLRLVNEWNGKEIKFPTRSVFTIQGKDTVDFDFKDAEQVEQQTQKEAWLSHTK